MTIRVRADSNGCHGRHLCLSHGHHATIEAGTRIALAKGMEVVAYERLDEA